MDTSTQMTENLSGFHILEIHMPSMGTGRGLLLLVGAAVLALRWWVQRRHAKKMWLKGGSTARPTRWAAVASLATPTSHLPARSGCMGGTRPGAGSRSCPREQLVPPSPARRATRGVGWPRRRPRGKRTTWREGPPLGAAEGKEDEVVQDVAIQKKHTRILDAV